MALTLHFHRSDPSAGTRWTARSGRRAEKRVEVDLDAVYRDDDFLDDHD